MRGGSTMIVLGAGWPGRTSLGYLLPWTPHCQVSPFTSMGGGGRGRCIPPPPPLSPPPLLILPRDPRGLPVWAERVDFWIRPPMSTSCTGGASSATQYRSRHLPSLPNCLCESGLCECRPPQCVLHTPLRRYDRQNWRPLSIWIMFTPIAAASSITVRIQRPGPICICGAGWELCYCA